MPSPATWTTGPAGARRLVIHVELGGKQQVRVEDDGEYALALGT